MVPGGAEKNENSKWLITEPSETSAFNGRCNRRYQRSLKKSSRETRKMEQDVDNVNVTKRPKKTESEKCPLD